MIERGINLGKMIGIKQPNFENYIKDSIAKHYP